MLLKGYFSESIPRNPEDSLPIVSTLSPGFLSQKTRKFFGRSEAPLIMQSLKVFCTGSFFQFLGCGRSPR